jgi:hypothetical protein
MNIIRFDIVSSTVGNGMPNPCLYVVVLWFFGVLDCGDVGSGFWILYAEI